MKPTWREGWLKLIALVIVVGTFVWCLNTGNCGTAQIDPFEYKLPLNMSAWNSNIHPWTRGLSLERHDNDDEGGPNAREDNQGSLKLFEIKTHVQRRTERNLARQ